MSNAAINAVSAALSYDAVESMLASGLSLASCYAFAAVALAVDCDSDLAPESAATVLVIDAATVRPSR
jgi:hypothetical protein